MNLDNSFNTDEKTSHRTFFQVVSLCVVCITLASWITYVILNRLVRI